METNVSTVYNDYCILIGSGVDFNSTPFNIIINAGDTDGRANISVTCDDVMEGSETFIMRLTLTDDNTGVIVGRNTSEGVIADTIGKCVRYI